MTRTAHELKATAYHEAGHAVAQHVLGRHIARVSIDGVGDSFDRIRDRFPIKSLYYLTAGEPTLKQKKAFEDLVVCVYAGPEAERRLTARWNHVGAIGDREKAACLILAMVGNEKIAKAYGAYLRTVAKDLVSVYWGLVDLVARELLNRRALSGAAVRQVLRAAQLTARSDASEGRERYGSPDMPRPAPAGLGRMYTG